MLCYVLTAECDVQLQLSPQLDITSSGGTANKKLTVALRTTLTMGSSP